MEWTQILFAQFWQVTLLVGLILATTRIFARNRPHLAYVLWMVVLIKSATPPFWSSPMGLFSWAQTSVTEVADPVTQAAAIESDAPFVSTTVERFEAPIATTLHLEPPQIPAPERSIWPQLAAGLLTIWAFGFAASILTTYARWRICMRQLRRSGTVIHPELARELHQLKRKLGVSRTVSLFVTRSAIGPAVVGLFRPVIVIPQTIVADARPQDLRAILAHELIHIRRGDLWLGLLQSLSAAIWWFYPLIWAVNAWMTREVELCTDEEVVASIDCDPTEYARSLLRVLEQKHALRAVPAALGVKPVEITKQRLERVMSLRHGCHRSTPRRYWGLMFLVSVVALPGAGFVAGRETPNDFDASSPLVADEPAVAPVATVAPIRMVIHDFSSAIEKIQVENKCSDEEARQLACHLLALHAGLDNTRIPLNLRMRILDEGRVAVAATVDEHASLKKMLAHVEELGARQVRLQVKFINVHEAQVAKLVDSWELALQHYDEAGPNTPPVLTGRGRSGAVTTTYIHPLCKTLDHDAAKAFTAAIRSDSRSNILAAPKLLLANGQTGQVLDQVERPFVVGMDRNGKGISPRIEVIREGRSLEVTPTLGDDDEVTLELVIEQSKIESVAVTKVKSAAFDEPIGIQIPTIKASKLSSTIKAKVGNSVLVRVAGEKAGERVSMVMVTPMLAPRSTNREVKIHRGMENWRFATQSAEPGPLDTHVTLQFERTSLSDAVSAVARSAGLSVNFLGATKDFSAPPLKAPVTIQFDAVKLSTALDTISAMTGCSYQLRYNTIFVQGPPRTYTAVYSVADLLTVTLPGQGQKKAEATEDRLNLLAEMIRENVAPQTWKNLGGEGAIHVFSANQGLVVAARSSVHQQLGAYLNSLRLQAKLPPHTPKPAPKPVELITKAYRVADLVVPIPNLSTEKRDPKKPAQADFTPLVDLVTTTIAPDTWSQNGGDGQLQLFEANLSLIVRQSEDTHREIADLLQQLRKLQSVQVQLKSYLIEADKVKLTEGTGDGESATLTAKEVRFVLTHAKKGTGKVLQAPTVTLFNGQTAALSLWAPADQRELKLQPVCTADQKQVRLSYSVLQGEQCVKANAYNIQAGGGVMLKMAPTADGKGGWVLVAPKIIL